VAPTIGSGEGLEFFVGRASLVLPAPFVERIVEVTPTPLPPVSPTWLRGVALIDERIVAVVGLTPRGAGDAGKACKGILLRSDPGQPGWVIEAGAIGRMIAVRRLADGPNVDRGSRLPVWIARARTSDDRVVGWIDVPAMLLSLQSRRDDGARDGAP
jgi:hypothetical protein